MRKTIGFILSLALFVNLHAQQFGGNPPSLKWKQINTDTARIIFPQGMDSAAQRVASIVHQLAAKSLNGTELGSLGNKLFKVDIVLQNQTTIANGYAGLGPFRSEFFLTPQLNNFEEGSISWTDLLAVHEYRHVQQFNNFRNGLSKGFHFLFGEEGLALAINASVPDWFYEGDAVYNETVLTNQGRGRLPLFNNAFPSLIRAKKNYSWMKLRNGSLKDYVPNHYYLGYLLVNYGREKYGVDFWKKVTADASAFKGLFYPFQKAIKRHSGQSYENFLKDAEQYYRNIYKTDSEENVPMENVQSVFPVNEKYVTSYQFPYRAGNDSLIYMKSSYRHRPAFYVKTSNGEARLRTRDISIDEQFSYRNGQLVYAAYEPDARWGWKNYSVIKLLDVASGKQTNVTSKTKYFTPDISPNGNSIAAVQILETGKSTIHIIETGTGKLIKEIGSSEISLFTDPKFINDNLLVTVVRLKDGKSALALAEIESGNTMRLTNPSFNVVGYPSVNGDSVYFTASYGGNDNVFMVNLKDKKVYRITSGQEGKYFVNASNGMLTWSMFTAEGYQLQEMKISDATWQPVNDVTIDQVTPLVPVSHASDYGNILQVPFAREFAIKDYSKSTGLLNFHSWRPYYEDPIFTFSLYGENVLNTLRTEVYYLYNQDEQTHAAGVTAVYGGLFPYISAGTEFTFAREQRVGNRIRHWDQLDSRIGYNIPLNFSRGRLFNNLNFGSNYFLRNEYNKGFFKDSLGNRSFSYLHHFISWSQQVQRATQHIYPRLGYALSANYRHAITDVESWQLMSQGAVYLPGLVNNHHLVVTGAFQQTDTLNAAFSNIFPYARGYNRFYFARMWKVGANYHFPLIHPDFGFGNILYLQRLRANAFYDFAKVYSNDLKRSRDQRSVGVELYADTKWWNQYALTFGVRVSRLLDRDFGTGVNGTVFEFILPVSIIPR